MHGHTAAVERKIRLWVLIQERRRLDARRSREREAPDPRAAYC